MLAPIPYAISDDPGVRQWLTKLRDAVNVSPQVVASMSLTDQVSSLGPILTVGTAPTLVHGVYRVSVQIRVTGVSGSSSSLRHFTTWTDGGVLQSRLGPALVGNVTTEWDSDVYLIRADAGTAIDISTIWASAGPPDMQYEIDAFVEAMPPQLAIP